MRTSYTRMHCWLQDEGERRSQCWKKIANRLGRKSNFVARTSKFDEMRRWYQTVLNAQVVFDNGTLAPPQRPGLGIELDRDALAHFAAAATALA